MEQRVLKPQPGPQERFLACGADICIYGGAAGGGKTYGMLLTPLRYIDNPEFGAVIFRHQYTQITNEGGLWDESRKLYNGIAVSVKTPKLSWVFPSGAKVSFAHISREEDLDSWQGSQIAMIGFDELTHFSESQFFYMLSRNRSVSGVKPFVRATCNPDADSWVAGFISWWIDPDTGYPIKERSGKIRYMVRCNNEIQWGDTKEELLKPGVELEDVKSVTFIASTLQDNKILMETNPQYLSNLKALAEVERERLLYGNWKIKPAAGLFFKRSQITMLESIPNDVVSWARGWDLAATGEDEKGNPAYTAGVLIGKRRCGRYLVADVVNQRLSASEVRMLILNTCASDKAKHGRVVERLPKDPGQAGKEQAQSYIKMLAGYVVKTIAESGSKESRAEPYAAQWQAGNVDVLAGPWNEMYFAQLESFPESKFKDMVDGSSAAFNELEQGVTYSVPTDGLGHDSYWR